VPDRVEKDIPVNFQSGFFEEVMEIMVFGVFGGGVTGKSIWNHTCSIREKRRSHRVVRAAVVFSNFSWRLVNMMSRRHQKLVRMNNGCFADRAKTSRPS